VGATSRLMFAAYRQLAGSTLERARRGLPRRITERSKCRLSSVLLGSILLQARQPVKIVLLEGQTWTAIQRLRVRAVPLDSIPM
jgi:hypothetical protein